MSRRPLCPRLQHGESSYTALLHLGPDECMELGRILLTLIEHGQSDYLVRPCCRCEGVSVYFRFDYAVIRKIVDILRDYAYWCCYGMIIEPIVDKKSGYVILKFKAKEDEQGKKTVTMGYLVYHLDRRPVPLF